MKLICGSFVATINSIFLLSSSTIHRCFFTDLLTIMIIFLFLFKEEFLLCYWSIELRLPPKLLKVLVTIFLWWFCSQDHESLKSCSGLCGGQGHAPNVDGKKNGWKRPLQVHEKCSSSGASTSKVVYLVVQATSSIATTKDHSLLYIASQSWNIKYHMIICIISSLRCSIAHNNLLFFYERILCFIVLMLIEISISHYFL
jgi:hypothetical protein